MLEIDITDQVNKEDQVELLSETAEHLARTFMGLSINTTCFLDHLHEGVVIINTKGDIQYMNQMAGCLLREILGLDSIPNQFQALPKPIRETMEVLSSKRVWIREVHFANKYIKIEGIPLLTKENIEGAIIIFTDITDLREKEKELILKSVAIQEIHHRVKNNLQNIASLLSLQMRRTDNFLVKEAFTDSINRILSMALVYDVLATQSVDDVKVKELCTRIMKLLLRDIAGQDCKIMTEIIGEDLILPSSLAVTLTLIINELASNVIKHAFVGAEKGRLLVEISADTENVLLIVRDDGKGFQYEEGKSSKHLGLKIIKVLVEEKLNGSFDIKQEQGTMASIRFPRSLTREA